MVRRPDQKNVVLRKQPADLAPALLDQLGVMRTQHSIVAGQQAVDLVEEYNRRTVLARSCKDFCEFLHRGADLTAQDVRRTERVEAAPSLSRNQVPDHGFTRARRADQKHACWN